MAFSIRSKFGIFVLILVAAGITMAAVAFYFHRTRDLNGSYLLRTLGMVHNSLEVCKYIDGQYLPKERFDKEMYTLTFFCRGHDLAVSYDLSADGGYILIISPRTLRTKVMRSSTERGAVVVYLSKPSGIYRTYIKDNVLLPVTTEGSLLWERIYYPRDPLNPPLEVVPPENSVRP